MGGRAGHVCVLGGSSVDPISPGQEEGRRPRRKGTGSKSECGPREALRGPCGAVAESEVGRGESKLSDRLQVTAGTLCLWLGLALPLPALVLLFPGQGLGRVGSRGPLGGEAPDKGAARAGAGGGVGEGCGSEAPTPRDGHRGRTLPRGLRGPEELRHWLTALTADCLEALGSQWGRLGRSAGALGRRGAGACTIHPGRWQHACWVSPEGIVG